MNDFEKGFSEELAKIAQSYTPEEEARLREIREEREATVKPVGQAGLIGGLAGGALGGGLGYKYLGEGGIPGAAGGALMGSMLGGGIPFAVGALAEGKKLKQLRQEQLGIHKGKSYLDQMRMARSVKRG